MKGLPSKYLFDINSKTTEDKKPPMEDDKNDSMTSRIKWRTFHIQKLYPNTKCMLGEWGPLRRQVLNTLLYIPLIGFSHVLQTISFMKTRFISLISLIRCASISILGLFPCWSGPTTSHESPFLKIPTQAFEPVRRAVCSSAWKMADRNVLLLELHFAIKVKSLDKQGSTPILTWKLAVINML